MTNGLMNEEMGMRGRWIFPRILKFIFVAVIAAGAFGFIVMSLWNALVPSLFHGPTLNYWQALGLLVLSRILCGGLKGHGGHHAHWRHRMRERWERMTPEERARLRESFRGHCWTDAAQNTESKT